MADLPAGFDRRECIACGLCLEVCPTYLLRRDEGSGPRGRIRLMDFLARGESDWPEWSHHLEECVGCLACQAHCPAGAPYGAMLESAQARLGAIRPGSLLDRYLRRRALALIERPRGLERLRLPLRLLKASGLAGLVLRLRLDRVPRLGFLAGLRWLPLPGRPGKSPPRPRPAGKAPYIHFGSCVGGLFHPVEANATRRVLSALGGYSLPDPQGCCGAVHRHLGRLAEAAELARRNIEACGDGDALIVSHAAGCGAALKEYGRWLADDPRWAERARRFSARVRDLSEVIDAGRLAASPPATRTRRAAWDDPCHALHAQGVGEGPRALLDATPGVERVDLPRAELCCGAGGTYFLRQPDLSREMIADKLAALDGLEVDELLTANTGCRLQWEFALGAAGSSVRVRHPAELWAEALERGGGAQSTRS